MQAQHVLTTPQIVRFTAPNPGPKTLDGTNTYVVGKDPAYIIDPGPDIPEHLDSIHRWIEHRSVQVVGVLLTHGHPDHASGAATLASRLSVPVWGSAILASEEGTRLRTDAVYEPGQQLKIGHDLLDVLPTPGHCEDHVAFWLGISRVLFSGDVILGKGTTLIAPPQGNMIRYMDTLRQLHRLRPNLIAPGHGPLINEPLAVIDQYVRHRQARERQICQALGFGPMTVQELVTDLYHDISPTLHALAEGSVQAQLEKLQAEGRVRFVDGHYSLAE